MHTHTYLLSGQETSTLTKKSRRQTRTHSPCGGGYLLLLLLLLLLLEMMEKGLLLLSLLPLRPLLQVL